MRTRIATLTLLAAVFAAPLAHAGSLPAGDPGQRPGPDLLYRTPATSTAPQLSNSGIWKAPPILVSGATAYRAGEFLYQDFLYDDHGAKGSLRDPDDPRTSGDTFSAPNGTLTYPTGKGYNGNAADLVELRVRPGADVTSFRVTLNTMVDPSLAAFTIALGDGPPVPVPHAPGTTASAARFLTVHGTTAELTDATGKAITPAPTAAVDTTRRQIEVAVPHAAYDPGTSTVKMAAAVGLWDKAKSQYLVPQFAADATHPGGGGLGPSPSPFFNAAFRTAEPLGNAPGGGAELITNPAWWRDRQQGAELAKGSLDAFAAKVDFAKLTAGVNDDSGVPQTGAINRIMASHFETSQGRADTEQCGKAFDCQGELRGQLQPYSIYVPAKPRPAGGWPLTLLLHSLGANVNQFQGSRNQSQFGDRGAGSIVLTAAGRGPDGWYYGHAGADTFEMWADAAQHYALDPDRAVIAGYSMGGYGTFKFATQFPDLFARGQPTVGPPGLGVWLPPGDPSGGAASNTNRTLASLRNVPFLMFNGSADELVPLPGPLAQAQTFDDLGYRYAEDVFTPAEHLTLSINDEYARAAEFLRDDTVNRDPPHVTYVVNPTMDFSDLGTRADHAYWLSALRLRNGDGKAPLGRIDARSAGFGVGDPPALPTQRTGGALTGGVFPAIAYTESSRAWGPAPTRPVEDRLVLDVHNLSSAAVSLRRAKLTCAGRVDVTTDGPLALAFPGCDRTLNIDGAGSSSSVGMLPAACTSRRTVSFRVRTPKGGKVSSVTVSVNGKVRRVVRGRALRRATVSLTGLPAGGVTVRVVTRLRTARGTRKVTETRRYRTCGARRE